MTPGTVAVTGGSGYIGGRSLARLQRNGFRVVSLGRRPVGLPGVAHREFELGAAPDPAVFDGVDVLVHCAYDFAVVTPKDIYDRNVVGTANLLRAARQAEVRRIVLISSMSAYHGTRQLYGRAKLESERLTTELGGVTLRLGLVWGAEAGGMAGAVRKLARLPVVPVLGAHSYQFTVHHDDVGRAIEVAVDDPTLLGVLGVAHPQPVPVASLINGLARLDGASGPGRLVPVPWQPVYGMMRAAEQLGVRLPLRADSVLGLVRPAPTVPGSSEWAVRDVRFRPFPTTNATAVSSSSKLG